MRGQSATYVLPVDRRFRQPKPREFGFEVVGVMCLVEREEAGGRSHVEKAAAPAPFVTVFTANDVRREHIAISSKSVVGHSS